jgi:sialic acid synthase SpsE
MVQGIRDAEAALGDGIKRPTAAEMEIRKVARKSIVAAVPVRAGTILALEMLDLKRPGTGISPRYLPQVVGRKARKDIGKDELLTWEMLS